MTPPRYNRRVTSMVEFAVHRNAADPFITRYGSASPFGTKVALFSLKREGVRLSASTQTPPLVERVSYAD